MKTYVIIAGAGLLIFAGGFLFLYSLLNKDADSKVQNKTAVVEQLDEAGKTQFTALNNAEFEDEALPLTEEGMSKL